MNATILNEYKRIRNDITFPAKWAIGYAREWDSVLRFESEYDISINVEFEDIPVRGNAIVSGNEEYDREVEDKIIERIDNGDPWAWGYVSVTVKHLGFEATTGLGACCYNDELDFKRNGYYRDMISECLDEINDQIYSDQSGEH